MELSKSLFARAFPAIERLVAGFMLNNIMTNMFTE
jgi:hypothetical protein